MIKNEKIKAYILQLTEVYHGGNWLGENFDGKLVSVTPEQAFTPPAPGIHSIAEILWHCVYWRKVTIKRLQKDNNYREETIDTLNWLPLDELRSKGWNVIKLELAETQSQLLEMLDGKDDNFLINEYQPGKTFNHLLEGTVQHDVYHLGQIGLVARLTSINK